MTDVDPEEGMFPRNMEDREIVRAGHGKTIPANGSRQTAIVREISRLIEERTDHYANWGWKDPNAAVYLEAVLPRCRNPLVVFVVRNAFDLTMSLMAASGDAISIEQAMDTTFSTYLELWRILKKCGIPTLLVSYDRLLRQREEFVDRLAGFLRLSLTAQERASAVDYLRPEGGYHRFRRVEEQKACEDTNIPRVYEPPHAAANHTSEPPATKRPTLLDVGCQDTISRSDAILNGLDKNGTFGVEIGPFFNPIVAKKDGWNTLVVDFTDTERLRAAAESHSSPDIRRMAANVEEVEVVWRGEPLDELIRARTDRPLDYLVASHAIQYLPNLLGFLQATERVMANGGVMSLAIPDMRYTFDFFFAPSTLGQVLAAYRQSRRTHVPEQVFDAIARNASSDGAACWIPGTANNVSIRPSLYHAWNVYQEDVKALEYRDCHAWYFTPSSFELLLLECWQLGLTGFVIKTLTPATAICFGSEFLVQMERRRRPTEAERRAATEAVDARRQELLAAIVVELAERVSALPESYRPEASGCMSFERQRRIACAKEAGVLATEADRAVEVCARE